MDSRGAGPAAAGSGADETRLRAARAGDRGAFEEILRARLSAAWRLSAAVVGEPARAMEAVEHAFAAAWRELPRLDDPARFDAWFQRILVDECRMVARVAPGGAPPGAVAAASTGDDPGDPDLLPLEAALGVLDAAFTGLDPEDRAILVLHHLEARSIAEISAATHLPAGTVRWRLHESLAALRAALESPS